MSDSMVRREFMRSALAGAAGVALGMSGCGRGPQDFSKRPGYARRAAEQTGQAREITLVAAPGDVEVAPRGVYRRWLYNGHFPGPEIRLKEGDRLRVTAENRLPEGTTIHWHGVPVPNAMDGVPGVTQNPIQPGATFVYDFVAAPAGTYLYHSHLGLQLDRGLLAPLIVEEKKPHVDYDREYTLILDDFLPGEPQPLSRSGGGMGGMMGGMMSVQTPPYAGLLINGRLPESPAVFETRRGQRVRLRLLNPSGATTYRVAIAGHRMTVAYADGRPVKPHTIDALYIGMGERYDVIVEANNPGAWTIMAAPVEGNSPPAQAVLRYTDVAQSRPPGGVAPEGLQGGRALELSDLKALETTDTGAPDRTFDLTLSGGMMSPAWTINGQAYPKADPLEIYEGARVRVRMINHSMMIHPMHLHGHFFRVGDALKDTVIVPPHMGRVTFDFVADNPGDWFFHCHNIYHMESGMARAIRYK